MFNPTIGSAREVLDRTTAQSLVSAGLLVIDERRKRPKYFDGRFLAARDLTREQTYFLTRQSDLGRAGGSGVVAGLTVSHAPGSSTRLVIAPGHGITGSGEQVLLARSLVIDTSNVPEIERLDATFGLQRIPREPARNRTGLYIVALRPVEFTANPIASYPTSLTGERRVEDGDIIEATAVTLIPYPDDGGDAEIEFRRRARAVRDIFVAGHDRGLPSGTLPLAVVGLQGSEVRWIDLHLVRREVGAEHADVLGLGFAPRALREAHALQYEQHLRDVLQARTTSAGGSGFAATAYFDALPPVGRLPVNALDPRDFTQRFFPAEVDVDLSIVPEDEVPALVEESLLLPPIDLTAGSEALESTAVLVLVPVSRARFRSVSAQLTQRIRVLRTPVPKLLAQRRPLEVLAGIRPLFVAPPVLDTDQQDVTAWQSLLQDPALGGLLWYVRRRNIAYSVAYTGRAGWAVGDESSAETRFYSALADEALKTLFARIQRLLTDRANGAVVRILSNPVVLDFPVLLRSALLRLEVLVDALAGGTLNYRQILQELDPYNDVGIGEGLARVKQARPELLAEPATVRRLAESNSVIDLDRLTRSLPADRLRALVESLDQATNAAEITAAVTAEIALANAAELSPIP